MDLGNVIHSVVVYRRGALARIGRVYIDRQAHPLRGLAGIPETFAKNTANLLNSLKNTGYTDLMVDGAPLPHQPDTIIRWLIDRLRS